MTMTTLSQHPQHQQHSQCCLLRLFISNYLEELPDDIKAIIYSHVYKRRFSLVLDELHANLSNRKHYNSLKYYIAYQEEPKINLIHYLSQNIVCRGTDLVRRAYSEDTLLSFYKKHLTSANIASRHINTIKIPANVFKYLDKIIAKTFVNYINKSKHNWDIVASRLYIDDTGEYYVFEYDRHFACFADLYLMLLSFWQFIRICLYEFYELHKEAYNIHIRNLLNNDYNNGIYMWFGGNIPDDILAKMKGDNTSLYRKIIRQRRNIHKSECLYINFEIRNNIEGYIIEDNAIIMRLKEM